MKKVKLFTQWNDDNYLTGNVGDYLTIHGKDMQGLDIIG